MSDPNPHLSLRSSVLNREMTAWSYDDLKDLFEGDENFALYLEEADHEAVFFHAHGRFWLFNHLPTTEVHSAAPEVVIDRIGGAAPKEPGAEPVLMHRAELPNHVRGTVESVEEDPPEHPYDELEREIGSDGCNHEALRELDDSERREMWAADDGPVECPDCGDEFDLRKDGFDSGPYLVKRSEADEPMTDGGSDSAGAEQCKRCKDPIEGEPVIMLHGRFPMHGDCYDEVIGA